MGDDEHYCAAQLSLSELIHLFQMGNLSVSRVGLTDERQARQAIKTEKKKKKNWKKENNNEKKMITAMFDMLLPTIGTVICVAQP